MRCGSQKYEGGFTKDEPEARNLFSLLPVLSPYFFLEPRSGWILKGERRGLVKNRCLSKFPGLVPLTG